MIFKRTWRAVTGANVAENFSPILAPLSCVGAAVDCSAVIDPCLASECNPATGLCDMPEADGTPCADDDLCDGQETCGAGLCLPGTPVLCVDDQNPCTEDICVPSSGQCGLLVADGTPCGDGDPCNGGEACQSGACVEGDPVVCADDGDPCIDDVCDPGTGACGVPAEDGTSCDDGDLCTTGDACLSGTCQDGAPVLCGDDGNPCVEDVCDAATGQCGVEVPDGAPCGDGNLCDGAAACQSGACLAGEAVVCEDDGDPCIVDVCDPGTGACGVPAEDGTSCDDGDLCTTGDACLSGACQDGAPVLCGDDGNPCVEDVCDPSTGTCGVPAQEGTTCDDGDSCTTEDECFLGTCAGTPMDCGDGSDCTDDWCEAGVCEHENNALYCTNYFYDGDEDQFGVTGNIKCLCTPWGKYTATQGEDCDDSDPFSYPDAPELCDGGDNDCNGEQDEDFPVGDPCDSEDSDLCENGTWSCTADGLSVECVNEDAMDLLEICGGGDENCDGLVDEEDALGCMTFYEDLDGDDWGNESVFACLCVPESDLSAEEPGDCDEDAPEVHPGAALCGIDADCDGAALDVGEGCEDGNDVDWDGCNDCEVVEFVVSSQSVGNSTYPSVATNADGGFMVVWENINWYSNTEDVVGKIFDAEGQPVSGEFLMTTSPAGSQRRPDVAALPNGRYIAVWRDTEDPGVNITGQIFTSDGEAEGALLQLSNPGSQDPSVATLGDGAFVVVWEEQQEIYGRVFDSQGTPESSEFQLGSNAMSKIPQEPEVAGLQGGGFVVSWETIDLDGSDWGVFGQVFDSSFQKSGSEFQVNTTFEYSQVRHSLAPAGGGGFFVTWESVYSPGQIGHDIFGQFFDQLGVKSGPEFMVNPTELGNQTYPAVAMLGTGNLVVVWKTDNQARIAGQLFGADGVGFGDEFLPASMLGSLYFPCAAGFADGGFVLVWTSNTVNSYGDGVVALRFDEQGNRIYH